MRKQNKPQYYWIKWNGEIVKLSSIDFLDRKLWRSGKFVVKYNGKNLWIWKFWKKVKTFKLDTEYFVYLDKNILKAIKKILKEK